MVLTVYWKSAALANCVNVMIGTSAVPELLAFTRLSIVVVTGLLIL